MQADEVATETGIAGLVAALARIATPLAIASLSQIAMGLTDTILLGHLGGGALAAGGLATTLFFTTGVVLQGTLVGAGVLAAQARGAGREGDIAGTYATALLVGLLLSAPAFLLYGLARPALLWLGEPPALAHDVGRYLAILRWATPAFVGGLGVLRAVLPAIGQSDLLLRVTPLMAVANGLVNYALIYGVGPLRGLGLRGSALATTLTLWASALVLFGLLHGSRRRRRLVAPPRLDLARLAPLLRLGLPISATIAAETLLFLVSSLAAGRLGADPLAAHQVILSVGTFLFMVPMALGQAANVLTGIATGAGDRARVRRTGLVAIGLGALLMAGIGLALLAGRGAVAAAFLDPLVRGNARPFALTVSLLGIMALFQVVDGVQAVAIGALRGMGDSAVPMVLATVGYWLIGFPLGWLLAFRLGLGIVGLWTGLAAALAAVAVMMTVRFLVATRRPGTLPLDPAGAAAPGPDPLGIRRANEAP